MTKEQKILLDRLDVNNKYKDLEIGDKVMITKKGFQRNIVEIIKIDTSSIFVRFGILTLELSQKEFIPLIRGKEIYPDQFTAG